MLFALPDKSKAVGPEIINVSTAIVPEAPAVDIFTVDSTIDLVILPLLVPVTLKAAALEDPVATTILNAEPVSVVSGNVKSLTLVIVIIANRFKLMLNAALISAAKVVAENVNRENKIKIFLNPLTMLFYTPFVLSNK